MFGVVLGVVAADLGLGVGLVVDLGVGCGVCAAEFGLGVGFWVRAHR